MSEAKKLPAMSLRQFDSVTDRTVRQFVSCGPHLCYNTKDIKTGETEDEEGE